MQVPPLLMCRLRFKLGASVVLKLRQRCLLGACLQLVLSERRTIGSARQKRMRVIVLGSQWPAPLTQARQIAIRRQPSPIVRHMLRLVPRRSLSQRHCLHQTAPRGDTTALVLPRKQMPSLRRASGRCSHSLADPVAST